MLVKLGMNVKKACLILMFKMPNKTVFLKMKEFTK